MGVKGYKWIACGGVSYPPPPPWNPPGIPPPQPQAPKSSRGGLFIGLVAGLILLLIVVGAAYLASLATGGTALMDMRRGDCFNLSKSLSGRKAVRVSCSTAHTDEVVGTLGFPADDVFPYPGREGIIEQGKRDCPGVVSGFYAGKSPSAADTFVFGPDEGAWKKGERTILCTLRDPSSSKRTGSYLDA